MTLALFNALLILVGPFMAVGLLAIPVLVQWPAPASAARAHRRVFAGPQMAGGGWR